MIHSDEVLAATAAAAAKGKEVGERRLLDRRDTESRRRREASVDIDGDVRLDARVPACLDASSGWLLDSSVTRSASCPQNS